jgi:hypothetical protein
MVSQAERLEGRRLVQGSPYAPTVGDNARAWAAIQPLLLKAAPKGARYESLDAAARTVRSITNAYIPYMVKLGHIVVLQQND